jgi:cobalt-zinc-cadmium efflux system outer membrane protein
VPATVRLFPVFVTLDKIASFEQFASLQQFRPSRPKPAAEPLAVTNAPVDMPCRDLESAGMHPSYLICLAAVCCAGPDAATEKPVPAETAPLPNPAAPATGTAHPLCLADLENLALQNNPTLAQAAAVIEHSRGMAQQAGLYPNPTIGYSGELMGVNGTAGEFQGAFIQQMIVTAGKLRLSRAKYNQAALEAELRAQGQQLRVVNGVHLRFYELLAEQRMIELHRRLQKNAEESLRTHKEMFNTGQANEADVLLQEVAVSRATIALRVAENRYLALWHYLAALVGLPDLPPAPLLGSLEPEGPPLDWDCSLQRLLADSPELQVAQAHVVYDQITLQREKRQPIPDIQIQAGTGHDFESPGTVANAQVSIEVPLFDRNQGTIRQVKADLARSQADVQRVELSLRSRLAEAFDRYLTAEETSRLYQEINVPKTTEAYRIDQEMYRKRRLAWPRVVQMERELLQTESEYTHSLLELRRAEVAIKGLLMLDGLESAPGPNPVDHLEASPKPR